MPTLMAMTSLFVAILAIFSMAVSRQSGGYRAASSSTSEQDARRIALLVAEHNSLAHANAAHAKLAMDLLDIVSTPEANSVSINTPPAARHDIFDLFDGEQARPTRETDPITAPAPPRERRFATVIPVYRPDGSCAGWIRTSRQTPHPDPFAIAVPDERAQVYEPPVTRYPTYINPNEQPCIDRYASSAPVVAENGSYYGEISDRTGMPKTVHVNGYVRRDGTYVRSHFRSR